MFRTLHKKVYLIDMEKNQLENKISKNTYTLNTIEYF